MKSNTKLKPIPDSSRYRRVAVALQGALRIDGFGVEIVETNNISEGGVGLTTLDPCPLQPGEEVHLHLNGIVSNEEAEVASNDDMRLDTYKMLVVHVDRNSIGLAFQ